jgi:murein DD-endopeptidase MepM/ murein hydrolase activator NlpD
VISTLIAIPLLIALAGPGDGVTAAAEKLVEQINAGEDMAIWARFDTTMQGLLPKAKVRPFFDDVRSVGRIIRVETVSVDGRAGQFRLIAERGVLDLNLSVNKEDRINGLTIRPASDSLPEPSRTRTPLRLPFNGTWDVFWGGPTREQNAHHDVPNQRRALDIIIIGPDGKSFTGDGSKNSDYLCYGKELLAPAAGTVVMVVDGVPENKPGSMNHFMATGNCVMIRFSPSEYGFIAHLQPHTVRVKVGDEVKPGQVLGLCGNSGNSSEPHLHFHVQDSEVFQDGLGVTPYFKNIRVTRGGKATDEKDYTPVKGDKLAPM